MGRRCNPKEHRDAIGDLADLAREVQRRCIEIVLHATQDLLADTPDVRDLEIESWAVVHGDRGAHVCSQAGMPALVVDP
jgi:hypothetical protein